MMAQRRMRCDQLIELCKNSGLVTHCKRRNETDRHESVEDHFLRASDMLVREMALFERREASTSGCGEWAAPVALVKARRIAFVRRDDCRDRRHPINRIIAHVPDQAQLATGLEHTVNFSERRLGRNKLVKRLRANQGIYASG